ncbi:MAG TPA: long-chain fatty acid--CoA ligase [Solirubrobacterales bacterium]|nr:long-chain fatty acid--CoA ligase [Solirubrobacterales bacterium]
MLIDGLPLKAPAAPLGDLPRVGFDAAPEEPALVSATRSMSWRELEEESERLAGGYRSLGLEPGDRVASLMPNRIALIVHYLACFKAGLVVTPLNYRYTHREIDHALEVSGAKALLAHVERAEDVGESALAAALPLGLVSYADPEGPGRSADVEWPHDFDRLLESEPLPAPPQPDPADPAAIFFTSGSTGPAKGVTHTRESLRWMIAGAAAAFELDGDDVFLPGSSMSHIGSFLWALSTLSVGGEVVVARTFDSHELLPLLRERRPTVLAMIPAALLALVRDHDLQPHDFASLRVCRCGSDKVSTELLHEFAAVAGFPIVEGYGMTEVGLATLNPPSGVVKQGSIGRPINGFSIALRGEDGEPVGADAVGRIFIRTRARMAGYWEAPEATAEVLREDWIDSGDLAPRRRGRLPLVLRPQEAGDRPRRLQHQPLRGRGRARRPPRRRPRRRGRRPRRSPRRERPRLRDLARGRRAPQRRRPDRPLPRPHRLQGPRGDRLPRRDAAQPDREDRPRRAEEDGRRPPAPARSGVMTEVQVINKLKNSNISPNARLGRWQAGVPPHLPSNEPRATSLRTSPPGASSAG